MALQTELDEVRVGRNFVRVGDTVKVNPSRPRKRDGFEARVTRIVRVGEEVQVEVYGGRTDRRGHEVGAGIRTFRLDRIRRVRQTIGGERVAGRRRAG